MESKSRTVAIGDVHGCLSLLEMLLEKLNYDPSSDRLVFVGDLIDRGPKPLEVVRLVRQLTREGDVITIKGNHEDKMIRWFRNEHRMLATGKPNPMQRPPVPRLLQWSRFTTEDIQWLDACPVFASVHPDWISVHAGFEAVPMDKQQTDRMMRVRWVSKNNGEFVPTDRKAKDPYSIPDGAVPWMEYWQGPKHVVYGHAIHSLTRPHFYCRPNGTKSVEVWGIDTGAYAGGFLTALNLDTRKVTQVKDGQIYGKLLGNNT